MTDRDYFAAAALTGLLAAPTDKDRSMDYWARLAFEAADAMLRERERVAESAESQQVAETCRSERHDATPPEPPAAGVTLTDAEREAISAMERIANRTERLIVGIGPRHAKSFAGPAVAATLRSLLTRLGGAT
jgi:hypothetical protein